MPSKMRFDASLMYQAHRRPFSTKIWYPLPDPGRYLFTRPANPDVVEVLNHTLAVSG